MKAVKAKCEIWKRKTDENWSNDVTKIQTIKLLILHEILLSWCIRAAKNYFLPQLLLISQSDWLICRGK